MDAIFPKVYIFMRKKKHVKNHMSYFFIVEETVVKYNELLLKHTGIVLMWNKQ